MWSTLLCFIVFNSVLALEIEFENPPPEQVDAEWVLIPDDEGNLHLVNTASALSEPQPRFNVEIGVLFELYTPENPHVPQLLRPNDLAALASSNFDYRRPTRIVSHGWNSKGDLTESFCRAYFVFANNNVNFIAVNWQAGSYTINYISARNRVNTVGPHLARMIDFLVSHGRMRLSDVIVIGHSLGAHVAGIAGCTNFFFTTFKRFMWSDAANSLKSDIYKRKLIKRISEGNDEGR